MLTLEVGIFFFDIWEWSPGRGRVRRYFGVSRFVLTNE